MKKVKNPRGKIRGKSMKKIFACLLSLSMIPANGVAVFATQTQAENASVQKNADVKTQANNTQESKVTFAQDSLVSKIGYFKNYKFEGIDEEDIASVQFEFIADGVLSLYPNYGQDKNGKYHVIGYSIDPKKIGDTRITAHITTTSGEVLTTPATKFKVESAESDVVPFTDTGLFNAVKSNLNLDSNTTHITKEQMKQVKKISGYLSDGNIDGIEYAENCEEVSLPNSYELSDISKLAQLTKLKKVNISNSQVMNITALQWLKNLTYVNLNNTKVSTEDRFSLFKTNDVSIEEGTKVTDLLNPKGLVQTSDTITSSDPSVISVQQEKKSNGTSEWVFKAAEGTEGKEATLTIQNDTQKKQIKVNVVAKDNSLPDFAEKSVETNIGCFLKVPLKNVDAKGSNLKFSSSDNTILDIAEKRSYQGYNEYTTTYYFEPKKEGKVTLIGYIEKDDGTKYKRTMEVTVQKVKENVVPIKDYEIFRNISNNEDYTTEITWDDLKDKKELYLYNNMTNEDMNWLSKAENCESLYLNSSYKLSNIEPLSKLSKLKTLNLDGTNISSAETLKAMKDHLQYLNINSTKISDKDRLDLMLNDTVSVQEGSSTEKVVHINGLLKVDDTVTVEDSDVAEAEVRSTENYPSYNYILLTAKKGQAGKSTKLTVTSNDGTSKEFTVNVIGRKEDAPGFANQSIETTIGKFSEIKFKNMSGAKVNISPKSLDKNIVDIKEEEKYDYDKDESITHYYLVPKSEGTTTITVQCKLDGTTYDDTMQISVGTDDQIAPIKDYGLYKAINSKLSNNLQSDHITKDTMSTLKTITANNRSITNLSGIEYATACKKINLSRNKKLKDIDKLKDLNKLENINLSDTAVQDISVLQNIKDQLTYLNLSNSKVPAADRLSFINDKQEISVEAGTKKQVVIKPTGILEAQDECTTEEDDAVKITNEGSGKVEINAENVSEGNVATLIISNSNVADKKITIPINVIAKDKNAPGFAQKSENIEIGNLEKVAFVNEQYTDIDLKSKDTNIIDIEGPYKDEPHFIPKSKGTTTVEATFKKNDGTIYTDSMTVTVKDADASQKITPIKSWETFDRLVQGNDLNLEDGQFKLTEEQMKEVKTISLSFMDGSISEDGLSGLDQAVNCEKFEVGYNGIDYTKIQPLIKKYSNLKSISFQLGYMNQKEFNDLIEANKNLEELKIDLYDSNEDFVEDVSKLKDLTNLKVLHLENVKITDLSGITDLSKLEELKLQYMKITDLSGIEKLTNLKNLDVYDARYIKDFEPISKLKNLESLGLCQTNIKKVDPLRNLEKLKYLNLNGTNVSAKDRLSLIRTKKIELEEGESNGSVLLPNGLIESYYGDRVELEQTDQGIQLESNGYEIVLKAQRDSVGAKTNLLIKNKDEICAKIPIEVVSEKAETVGFKDKEKTISIGYFGKIDIKNEGDLDEEYWITTSKSSDTEDNEDILNVVERDGAYYYEPIKTGKVTLIGHFTAKDGKRYERNLDVTITNESEGILPISNYKIFTALLDDNGNSVDVNKDYMIDREEIKNVTAFKANYSSVEDKDFDYLTKAVNCKTMDLSDNKALIDLSFINSFKKLKEINLDGDEKISDYTPLVAHKTQFNKIILPAQAPDNIRKDLITTDNISLKEGQTATDVIQPVGLLKDTDTVSVDNNNIAEAKIVPDYDEDEEDIIGEHLEVTGKSKGTTILAIHMGSETKEINITVDAQNTNEKIKFADGSDKVKVAQFKSYNFANVKASNIKDVEFKYGQDDVLKMVQNEDNSYTPIALKDSGKVTVSAEITLKNGLKETVEEKEFTVEPADKEAVIIKDYDLYKGMKNNGKSVDVDQNGIISKDEIANVDEIKVINSEIKDLSGVEQAVNCKKVDFSNDAFLKDISALSELTNLTSLNLRDTAVENIDALKGLTKLDTVNLDDSYVKESDKIALLRLNDMSMTEGETKTQQIIPTGVLGKDIDVSIDSDIAEAKITDGKLEVTGKAAGVADLTIGNKGKKETRTIKVTVQKKQEEPKPNPNPINPGDNKPQIPSQNPTTEAPIPTQPTTSTVAPKKVEKITVTAPSNKVASGKKVKLTANISNDASNKNIKWTTSNKKYATVDKNGVVKFNKKAAGKTVIITAMATDGSGKKATFKIKIMKGSVQKITISGKKSVKAGKTLKLKAKVKAGKGANKKLTWTSSNTNYATVSSSGTVKALKAGKKKSVKITAMATDGSGKKATVTIKIK